MNIGGVLIGEREIDLMSRATVTIFEVLERAWATLGCSLIDMKVEFGVDAATSKYSARPFGLAGMECKLLDSCGQSVGF